jgi:hypothetical protein
MAARILSARASRTFYNVADVMVPPTSFAGAGDVDLIPWVERSLRARGPGAARRAWLVLTVLEWWPIVTLQARRGFSRAPLEQRRSMLARWRRSRLGVRRAALEALEALIQESLERYASSVRQLSDATSQSEDGS